MEKSQIFDLGKRRQESRKTEIDVTNRKQMLKFTLLF